MYSPKLQDLSNRAVDSMAHCKEMSNWLGWMKQREELHKVKYINSIKIYVTDDESK
jgi:hypothetical protein